MYEIGDEVYLKGCERYNNCISCYRRNMCSGKHEGLLDSYGGFHGKIDYRYVDGDFRILLPNGNIIAIKPSAIIKKYEDKFEQHKQRLLNA